MMLDRRKAVAELLADRGDLLMVAGLGSPGYDAAAAGDSDANFYLWGAMGGAAMVGLGLALARPERPVLVLTGDGEMLMGIGSLATIAALAPANLSIAVLDNGRYGETGSQHSHTALGTDLAAVARGCGWKDCRTISDMAGVTALRGAIRQGPVFAAIRIDPAEVPRVLPPRDGTLLVHRFRAALDRADNRKN